MSDDDLRRRFEALRREEDRAAPDFRRTLAAARVRAVRRRPWLPALAAAAAIAAIALAVALPRREPPPAPWTPGRWAMPSDVLLDLPGSMLLRELPSIGTAAERPAAPRRTSSLRRYLG